VLVEVVLFEEPLDRVAPEEDLVFLDNLCVLPVVIVNMIVVKVIVSLLK